uniref:G-protein coupled receptors family 1 profile domain-containing protein n=1 Tax=Timema genevievae TaxID=629358 RepID=A0A7R9PGX9_TIMGE|nr:unnamed protein product [Timema genevievae]
MEGPSWELAYTGGESSGSLALAAMGNTRTAASSLTGSPKKGRYFKRDAIPGVVEFMSADQTPDSNANCSTVSPANPHRTSTLGATVQLAYHHHVTHTLHTAKIKKLLANALVVLSSTAEDGKIEVIMMQTTPLCLETGSILTTTGAVMTFYLVSLQMRKGASGYTILSTSDTLATLITGLLFILNSDNNHHSRSRGHAQCDHSKVVLTAALFLAPFVNAFMSIMAHSYECLRHARGSEGEAREQPTGVKTKIRLIVSLMVQWIVPAVATLTLLSSNVDEYHPNVRSAQQGEECSQASLYLVPTEVDHNCIKQPSDSKFVNVLVSNNTQPLKNNYDIIKKYTENNKLNSTIENITSSIIQKIYDIVHESLNSPIKESENTFVPSLYSDWQFLHKRRRLKRSNTSLKNDSKQQHKTKENEKQTDDVNNDYVEYEVNTQDGAKDDESYDYDNYSNQPDPSFDDNITHINQDDVDLEIKTHTNSETPDTGALNNTHTNNAQVNTESSIQLSTTQITHSINMTNPINITHILLANNISTNGNALPPLGNVVGGGDVNFNDIAVCLTQCFFAGQFLRGHLFVVLFLCYLVPISTATVMYIKTNRIYDSVRKPETEESEPSSSSENKNEECKLKIRAINKTLKQFILVSVILWTPSLVETLLRVWFCVNIPGTLSTVLFALAQFHGIVRNILNIKLARIYTKGAVSSGICRGVVKDGTIHPKTDKTEEGERRNSGATSRSDRLRTLSLKVPRADLIGPVYYQAQEREEFKEFRHKARQSQQIHKDPRCRGAFPLLPVKTISIQPASFNDMRTFS